MGLRVTSTGAVAAAGLCAFLFLGAARADDKPASGPRSGVVTAEAWKSAPRTLARPQEIDRLVSQGLKDGKIEPAPRTTDEQFLRRIMLDLTGELPMPADVEEFLADKDPQKRAKLIDRLLAGDEFARHQARYWRDVIMGRTADFRARALQRSFEQWMTAKIKENVSWGEVVRAMLTAEGELRFFEPAADAGAGFFLASRVGADANIERASEASRIFLGIQIQCAQCHNHPFDEWKQNQFHEFAAYFARLRERPIRDGMRIVGLRLVSVPFGEHQMPGKDDPRKTTTTHPRYLDGMTPGEGLGDLDRRKALAKAIVDKQNPWFAAAFVNRVWGDLVGQAFYQPVDDLGPGKEAVFPEVLTRLAGSFQASDYDVRAFYRLVLNTDVYQRQSRLGESADQHLQFAASYPTRLRADALWQSLVNVLGALGRPGEGPPPGPFAGGRPGFRQPLEGTFKEEFAFDPSMRPDEIEGSIPQALLLMNNSLLNQRIEARGTNLLARILSAYPKDDDALRMVYLRALARKPTDRELEKCRAHVAKVDNRAEAFEDILWALINSTEFQTKR